MNAHLNVSTPSRSRLQLVLDLGSVWMDFAPSTNWDILRWDILRSSFDGHGCCSTVLAGVPNDLVDRLFGDFVDAAAEDAPVAREDRSFDDTEQEALLRELAAFVTSRRGVIPANWHDAFEEYGLFATDAAADTAAAP